MRLANLLKIFFTSLVNLMTQEIQRETEKFSREFPIASFNYRLISLTRSVRDGVNNLQSQTTKHLIIVDTRIRCVLFLTMEPSAATMMITTKQANCKKMRRKAFLNHMMLSGVRQTRQLEDYSAPQWNIAFCLRLFHFATMANEFMVSVSGQNITFGTFYESFCLWHWTKTVRNLQKTANETSWESSC